MREVEWHNLRAPELRDLARGIHPPILTDRGGNGTRHVPSYSPYGGLDLAAAPTRA